MSQFIESGQKETVVSWEVGCMRFWFEAPFYHCSRGVVGRVLQGYLVTGFVELFNAVIGGVEGNFSSGCISVVLEDFVLV